MVLKKLNCIFTLIVLFYLTGCLSFMYVYTDQYSEKNIRIVTHLNSVQGMTYLNGKTSTYAGHLSTEGLNNFIGNDLAMRGIHDVTVLVEILQMGNSEGQDHLVKVSIYQPKEIIFSNELMVINGN